MARRRTKAEEIKNPENYFNKYVAKEIQKDLEKKKEYDAHHTSLEEKLEGGEYGPSRKMQMLFAINLDDEVIEQQIADRSMVGWFEIFENSVLYDAVMSLTDQQKEILTWRFERGLSQRETAKIMNLTQQSINIYEKRILKKIKKFLEGVC